MDVIERISRVLAGQFYSRNAGGAAGSEPAADLVTDNWRDFRDDAIAVLKTLREPTDEMAAAGDQHTWHDMVEAALHEPDLR